MSHQRRFRNVARQTLRLVLPLWGAWVSGFGPALARAQPPSAGVRTPATTAPGVATAEPAARGPALAPEVQVVRFQPPQGVTVEILAPRPEPIPAAPGAATMYGLKVGVGYRLRLANLPGRPGPELFPVIEVVGHLHRPAGADPTKFPIRIVFTEPDFADAVDRGRLVTQVVYLEDPEQALPMTLPKGEIPIATIGPAEDPLKVGAALGRVMAIVRLGGRRPTVDEIQGAFADVGGPELVGTAHCPFTGAEGSPCGLPCGPARGAAPPPGRPWVPRDEYLCDGGDHAEVAHFGGDGGLMGIDPRDAVIQFGDVRPRILPTNLVCVYAPRFAEVRVSVGPNENLSIEASRHADTLAAGVAVAGRQSLKKLVRNQSAEVDRDRVRAMAARGRVFASDHAELRVLGGYNVVTHIAGHVHMDVPTLARNRQKPGTLKDEAVPLGIKTAESAVVTGIVQGAGETVMSWKPAETVGVELPPNKPGLAVIKRVSAGEAEQGDELTFVIQYRNMGNTPIRAVSVIDSLLPRLGYIAGSAQGPKGTVFTAAENRVGSTELRWDLPGVLAPGAEGLVWFRAIVR